MIIAAVGVSTEEVLVSRDGMDLDLTQGTMDIPLTSDSLSFFPCISSSPPWTHTVSLTVESLL